MLIFQGVSGSSEDFFGLLYREPKQRHYFLNAPAFWKLMLNNNDRIPSLLMIVLVKCIYVIIIYNIVYFIFNLEYLFKI